MMIVEEITRRQHPSAAVHLNSRILSLLSEEDVRLWIGTLEYCDRIEIDRLRVVEEDRCLYTESEFGKPVHQHSSGKWWFWDETGTQEYGPYDTAEQAKAGMKQYAEIHLPAKEVSQ